MRQFASCNMAEKMTYIEENSVEVRWVTRINMDDMEDKAS